METIYLDNNSTTKPAPEVIEAVNLAMLDGWANPSSIHRPGQHVRQQVDQARQAVAKLIGCNDRDITFTAGGTESNNLAILGSVRAQPERRVIVTTRIEHSSIRELAGRLSGDGIEIIWLSNDDDGLIDVNELTTILNQRADEIALVSVIWVNNETGVINQIEQIGKMCHDAGVRFHTDATQRVGKLPVNVSSLPIDLLTFSGHKFHAPKGAGALYVKPRTRIVSHMVGGPQERSRRGGTENVPGILGLGAAAQLASKWLETGEAGQMDSLRSYFEERISSQIEDTFVSGSGTNRQWNTSNISFCGLETETILMMFSENGICASGGSACSSGSLEPSPVLQAMGLSPDCIHGSVRFSFSRYTTKDEIDRAVETIAKAVNQLRSATHATV